MFLYQLVRSLYPMSECHSIGKTFAVNGREQLGVLKTISELSEDL
jgi:hypothetical protein